MQVIDRAFVRGLMPARDQGGHKGTFGKVYLLGGSVGYTGAPVLCAGGAVHSGCGLVFLGVPETVRPIAAAICLIRWRSRTEGSPRLRRRRYATVPPSAMPWPWAAAWGGARAAMHW